MLTSFFKSRPHFLLIAGDTGVTCILRNVVRAPAPFFVGQQDRGAEKYLIDLLAQYRRAKVTLFADNLAQDLRNETLPGLNFIDRMKLIRRRLQNAFPQARYTASLPLSRTQSLFAGLQDNAVISFWLNRITPRLPEIALLPVKCAGLVTKLAPEAAEGWLLFLCRTKTGGFRQIILRKGEVVFTRLTPDLAPHAETNEIAAKVTRDITASLGYLARLGLEDCRQLRALVLMPEKIRIACGAVNLPIHSLRFVTPADAAGQLDLPYVPDAGDSYSDLLFAGWLAAHEQRRPRISLTSPELAEARQTQKIHFIGARVALAAFLFAVCTTVWQASSLVAAAYDRHRQSEQLSGLKEKFAQEQSLAVPITEPLGKLRVAVERQRIFTASTVTPWTSLQALSKGLGDEGRLVKIDWQNDGKDPSSLMLADVRFLHPLPSFVDRETTAAHFQTLAQNVALTMPGYEVNITRYPFPASPDEAATNNGPDKKPAAEDTTAELTMRGALQ